VFCVSANLGSGVSGAGFQETQRGYHWCEAEVGVWEASLVGAGREMAHSNHIQTVAQMKAEIV
jgi:hypothetical protein